MASGSISPDDFVRLSKEYAQVEPNRPPLPRAKSAAFARSWKC